MGNITLQIDTDIFNKVYLDKAMYNQNRYQIYFGGSSSGKSFFLAQRCILDVTQGRNYLITRNTANTIRKTVFNDILKVISNFKLTKYFKINRSEMVITCTTNNKQIFFTGLDDTEKLKGITPISGVITDIWVEEATECNYKAIKQLDKRLRGQSKFTKRLTLSFNPILKTHWIYKEYFNIYEDNKQYIEKDNVSILKTTYKDNGFLNIDDIHSLENEPDEYYYQVYTLGNWGVLGNTIFRNYRVENFDTRTFDKYYNGIDWGFGTDPFAFIRSYYDKKRKTLYICDEICSTGLTDEESAKMVKAIIGKERVCCDSSEPKSIQQFKKYKVNAYGAKKGKGSIESGIKFLQGLNIIIHPKCKNTINEFNKYKYKEDKEGNSLPIPEDKNNHLIDALRYSLEDVNKKWGTKRG